MSRRIWRSFDPLLLVNVLALVAVGLAMIHSATLDPAGQPENLWEDFVVRQAVYAGAGLVIMFLVAAVDYRYYSSLAPYIYAAGLGLLGLIFAVGQVRGGAQSWLDLRLFPLQPSELAKLALILILAKLYSDREDLAEQPLSIIMSLVLAAVPIALVFLQPDAGTALILGGIWAGIAWSAGAPLLHFGILAVGGLAAAPAVWFRLPVYMQDRIMAFLDPARDPSGASYNVTQALISIGSGGIWGKGFAHGTQSQLHFLRVRHTDYIYSVFAEEFGFVGSLVLFALFVTLLLRILRVASMARDTMGRLIVCGVALMILIQTMINLAVNLNLLPATGLPLPFVSYGGSSLISMLIGIGLVQSVVMRHRKLEFE